MIVARRGDAAFALEFETEQELRDEHAANLAHGALRLPTPERAPLYARLSVTLRGPWGGETQLQATVVALLTDALALGIEGDPGEILTALLTVATPDEPAGGEEDSSGDGGGAKKQTAWDRLRALSQIEKILLAVKAEKSDRALLLQETDPRVLLSLLRNPRLTVEEVGRLARSASLTFQIAESILKAPQWSGNLDVRLGLIHNPKTPQQFALRILATLPEAEVRAIARGGTSMPLKQAALRRLQKG